MTLQIEVTGAVNCPTVTLVPAAYEARRVALQSARDIRDVTDANSLEAASSALKMVKGLITGIENSRKLVKQPILDTGRDIDNIAKDYCQYLKVEADRLALIAGAYQEAERKKTERIRQEAMEKERQALAEMEAREAERIRQGGEREAMGEDLDAIRGDTADKIAATKTELAKAVGPKPEGLSARNNVKFEVTDIDALFKGRPDLCIISANRPAIQAIIKHNPGIPGVRVWSEPKAIVRSIKPVSVEAYNY
jgi:hypothetical protein